MVLRAGNGLEEMVGDSPQLLLTSGEPLGRGLAALNLRSPHVEGCVGQDLRPLSFSDALSQLKAYGASACLQSSGGSRESVF